MSIQKLKPQSGVSLIEVLVILAISAILVGFAVAQFGRAKDNFRRQNIARELKVNLERARFDSVKRRPGAESEMSKVDIFTDHFDVYVDLNQDGAISIANEKKTVDFSRQNDIKIVGNNLNFPITVRFDRRGHITVDASGNKITIPDFIVCDKGCTYATATDKNSNKISISQTGTVSMTGGGQSGVSLNTPNVSTVARCDQINDWVTVSDNSTIAGCGSPTPSTSPGPSGTPTGSPTAVPVDACKSGQKSTAGKPCTCYLPMTVKNGGQCI